MSLAKRLAHIRARRMARRLSTWRQTATRWLGVPAAVAERYILLTEPSPILHSQLPADRRDYRVLVPVANPASAPRMARMGQAMANARTGEVIVLHVDRSHHADGQAAAGLPPAVEAALDAVAGLGVPVGSIVRSADDIGKAVRRTALEQRSSVVVLGWREDASPRQRKRLGTALRAVLEESPYDVAVVGGQGDGVPSDIIVPMANGELPAGAVRLALDLAGAGGSVTVLVVLKEGAPEPSVDEARSQAQVALERELIDGVPVVVVKSPDPASGILYAIEGGCDGVVMAAPDETLLERLLFGRTETIVAEGAEVPVIVVKGGAGTFGYLARRAWRSIDNLVPNLVAAERGKVRESVARGSVANADFLVMIGLASAIASFGLLMNSPAVIIGAMLVAPLLSAMIGLGLGVVVGDLDVIRLSLGATGKGAFLAVFVAWAIGTLGPTMEAPSEVIARSQPNLWDLGVALAAGAAGAYSVSRAEVRAGMAGVAIAAAVLPPLAAAGLGLAAMGPQIALGAILLFLTNVVAVALSAGVTFLFLGFGPEPGRPEQSRILRRTLRLLVGLTVALGVLLAALTWRLSQIELLREGVTAAVTAEMRSLGGTTSDVSLREADGLLLVAATAMLPEEAAFALEATALSSLEERLATTLGQPVQLALTIVPIRVVGTPAPTVRSRLAPGGGTPGPRP